MPDEMVFLYVGSLMVLGMLLLGVVRAKADTTDAVRLVALRNVTTIWLALTGGIFCAAISAVLIHLYPAHLMSLMGMFTAG